MHAREREPRAGVAVVVAIRATCGRASAPSGAVAASPGARRPRFIPPIQLTEPASINNGRERFGLGAHSVLKATFMALETGAGSLAGVVLEARGVWPVERSPYASALANGGLVAGKP